MMSEEARGARLSGEVEETDDAAEIQGTREISAAELKAVAEALIFVADEPLSAGTIADVLNVELASVEKAIGKLVTEYDARGRGLQFREIACGWQIATRA